MTNSLPTPRSNPSNAYSAYHIPHEDYARLVNGVGAIGDALAEEMGEWFWRWIHIPTPEGFTDGLGAHIAGWLRNTLQRDKLTEDNRHAVFIHAVAETFESDGILIRCPHERLPNTPSWRLVR